MKTFRHCHMNVDAMLKNPEVLAGLLKVDGVTLKSAQDVKAFGEGT